MALAEAFRFLRTDAVAFWLDFGPEAPAMMV